MALAGFVLVRAQTRVQRWSAGLEVCMSGDAWWTNPGCRLQENLYLPETGKRLQLPHVYATPQRLI